MILITNKKFILPIIFIIGIIVYNFSFNDKKMINENVATKKIETSTAYKNSIKLSNNLPSVLQQKILAQTEKILAKKEFHKNILQARAKHLKQESDQRSNYLSYKAKYASISQNQIKRKFKSIKQEREKVYKQKLSNYNNGTQSIKKSQSQKRAQLNLNRIKSIQKIQQKKLLTQKYKGE